MPEVSHAFAEHRIAHRRRRDHRWRDSPVGCVAIANDGHNSLAMLKRRNGETLQQLLIRLDQAIAKAADGGEYTDEINA